MAYETEVILKQLLLGILKSETLEEAQDLVKYLCDKEMVAQAEKEAEKFHVRKSNR